MSEATIEQQRPPRENLLRVSESGVELRATEGEGEGSGRPVMAGHFAVFNQWTEINSYEGNFLEQFMPGSFKKTISENRDNMKPLFQHGYDYVVGDKPLGPIDELREDEDGVYYEVPLLDAPYVAEVLPGLEAGLYGASFRFRVIREEFDEEPGVSDDNPRGLPERKVKEVHVPEFGPVTFPAYEGASAGIRSLRASELAFAAAYDRMKKQDERQAHQLAARFATRDEHPGECTHPEGEVDPEDTSLCEDCRTKAAAKRDAEREGDEKRTDAPPDDSAEAEPHPESGRRGNEAGDIPLAGMKEAPPWRQDTRRVPPWHPQED